VIVPSGAILPIDLVPMSENQMSPSGPSTMLSAISPSVGSGYGGEKVPLGVILTTAWAAPALQNQMLPSEPAAIWSGFSPAGAVNSWIVPLGVIEPTALAPLSVNHRSSLGPLVRSYGVAPASSPAV
jgi:hypothetical protein